QSDRAGRGHLALISIRKRVRNDFETFPGGKRLAPSLVGNVRRQSTTRQVMDVPPAVDERLADRYPDQVYRARTGARAFVGSHCSGPLDAQPTGRLEVYKQQTHMRCARNVAER